MHLLMVLLGGSKLRIAVVHIYCIYNKGLCIPPGIDELNVML